MALYYIDALLASDLSHQIIKVDDAVTHWNVTNPTRQKCITAVAADQTKLSKLILALSLWIPGLVQSI